MKKLLFFTATWCSACKAIKPIVEKEAPEKGYTVTYFDLDDDEGAEAAEAYFIKTLPTLIVIENGKEIKRAIGNTAWAEIQK